MTGNTAGTGGNGGGRTTDMGRHDGIELADAVESARSADSGS
ncbi:hypothetical protein EDD95_0445 [Streptomyces sp. CEV 2-1]|nr:hypothetical protein [Streptomyces sp. CEV 2-1]ROQ80907.1 hypothetical protein EDD95_0445 [Streptomyces sp. CEV 2-1]